MVSVAASCDTDSGYDDENQLDAVEAGPAIVVGEEAKGDLADNRTEQSENVDERANIVVLGIRKVDKGDGRVDDVGCKEVISATNEIGL